MVAAGAGYAAGPKGTAGQRVPPYDPTGKRDIFEVPPTPTPSCLAECVDLTLIRLDAVIIGSRMDVAHLIFPGGRDLLVRVGDRLGINHGRVSEIRERELVVEEIYVDPADPGKIHVIERILLLP